MNEKARKVSKLLGGIFRNALFIFIGLRACDIIVWDWYWVLSPLLLSYVLYFLCTILIGGITMKLMNEKE